MPGLLLDTLNGKRGPRVPLWLMRQAGRYLPEYRALREEKGGFLALAYDSEAACEITLQPIDRFGFDGAILFSDILIVPHAIGQHLEFLAGEGPKLSPPLVEATLEGLVLLIVLVLMVSRGWLKRPGAVAGTFFMGYGIGRFVVEFFRQPDAQFQSEGNPLGLALQVNGYGLTMGQLLTLPMILGGALVIWVALRRARGAKADAAS